MLSLHFCLCIVPITSVKENQTRKIKHVRFYSGVGYDFCVFSNLPVVAGRCGEHSGGAADPVQESLERDAGRTTGVD